VDERVIDDVHRHGPHYTTMAMRSAECGVRNECEVRTAECGMNVE